MRILSLIDNTRIPQRKDLHVEPGLALSIQLGEQHILFDTGVTGAFLSNAQKMNVDIAQVNLVVISHHHFDHGGGIRTFIDANQHSKIYLKSSPTVRFQLDVYGLIKRTIGLDETLFQDYPQRFNFIDQFTELAPDVYILTKIDKLHPLPKGDRHLFMSAGSSRQLDDFEHELILVIRQNTGLVIFTGCSHHGILNMLDAVITLFPDQPIKAIFGGFHLIDIPLLNNMAGSKADVEALGRDLLKYPIKKIYTGHCTGQKAYRVLKEVLDKKLEYFATGCQVDL